MEKDTYKVCPLVKSLTERIFGFDSFKKAFTLAEIISVVVILGLVAALVIPSTIKNATEKQRKVKIKKAMATYNTALEVYYLNGFGDFWAKEQEIPFDNNYEQNFNNLYNKYIDAFISNFNTSEVDTQNHLIKTKDGLWWNLLDDPEFFKIVVAFKKEDATEDAARAGDYRAFYFTAYMPDYAATPITNKARISFDNPNLADGKKARQSIMAYLVDNENSKNEDLINEELSLSKLYNFIGNKPYKGVHINHFCTSYNCCKKVEGYCAYTQKYSKYRKQIYLYKNGQQVYTAYSYNPEKPDEGFYWEIYKTTNGGSCMEYRGTFTEGDCSSKTPSFNP